MWQDWIDLKRARYTHPRNSHLRRKNTHDVTVAVHPDVAMRNVGEEGVSAAEFVVVGQSSVIQKGHL